MNPQDQKNLDFIMSLNDREFDRWMQIISDDDINYAMELIQRRRAEILIEEQDLIEVEDLTMAKEVLAQFRL